MAGPGADALASAPGAGAGTFVFADIAGFTALTEAHGDHRAAELADDFADDVRGWLDRRGGGQVVKTIGDAVMVRCDTAAAAVELGLRVIGESGATHGSPMVRVGMHSGQAVERRGDYFGGVVNLAARIAGIAAGGQVLLSDATRTLLADDDRFATEDLGPYRLRNLPDPVRLHAVLGLGASPRAWQIDPVCRMALDPSQATVTVRASGVEHHFCSLQCAGRFAAAPERFADGARRATSA